MIRTATHAGSWYSNDDKLLSAELAENIRCAEKHHEDAKAVICPHAGYAYCGKTAAWSWAQLNPSNIDRLFVLGPSHHVYLSNCALPSPAITTYQTPLGAITLDQTVLNLLRGTGEFDNFDISSDQDEHSIELQLPYIKQIMGSKPFSLVPIVVGDLSQADLSRYGDLLVPYFRDMKTVFVISSDFCHWGRRFRYSYVLPESSRQQWD
eukprot:GHVS01091259.1.p1 GENE.GHVS01091259.1~~GHVS01091259.1.p1  ORF type:complete len:208 (+),score=13.54 GHVS01091259.1:76-699(+)